MTSLEQLPYLYEESYQEWDGVTGSALRAHDATMPGAGEVEGWGWGHDQQGTQQAQPLSQRSRHMAR